MPNNWTPQQLCAIHSTGGSVLVSAAAGSGKTAVLVERVKRLITDEAHPVDADRLLVVTFTKAAAAEMKQRINRVLSELLEADPYNPFLLKQKQRFYSATISTIDSFCVDLVREYFHTLDIAADFRIADDGEADLLSQKALDTVFEQFYEEDSPAFAALLQAFSAKSGDVNLRAAVLKISDFLSALPFPEQWMERMLRGYGASDFAQTVWGKLILENALDTADHLAGVAESAIAAVMDDEHLSGKFLPTLNSDREFLIRLMYLLKTGDWNATVEHLAGYSQQKNIRVAHDYTNHPSKLAVAAWRKEINTTVAKIRESLCIDSTAAAQELQQLYPIVAELFCLVQAYLDALLALKRQKNVLGFADIELLTVQLLASRDDDAPKGYVRTPQAEEIAARFDCVIVDEYQDVNDVQDLIFNCVSKDEQNLFVVGDVKQSIYGFRQAKPEIFLQRKESYTRYDPDDPCYPATVILDKNFRSRQQVCDTVNFIFSHLMSRRAAQMDYTEDEMLHVGASYGDTDTCDTELVVIDKRGFDEDASSAALEAQYIALKIRSMLSEGFQVTERDGTLRRAELSDFAVILRSTGAGSQRNRGDISKRKGAYEYVRHLQQNGIPAYCEETESFFEAQEIILLLHILRVIDNPSLDIPLLSVLCSPLYGFTPDELAACRAEDRYSSLYHSICSIKENNPKAAAFLHELWVLRSYANICTVDELLGRIYETTALPAVTAAVKGGSGAERNLNYMRVYARSFEENGYKTLSDFIAYIDRLIERGNTLGAATRSDNAAVNAVRVISIHKSKGLEYPVCFLADTGREFNTEDLKKDILIDSTSGMGMKRKQGVLRYNTLPRRAIALAMRRSQIAEELRVLYVALTRAKEKLIITGSLKNADKTLEKVAGELTGSGVIDAYTVLGSKSFLEWLLLCTFLNPNVTPYHASESAVEESGPRWRMTVLGTPEQMLGEAVSQAEEREQPSALTLTDTDYAALLMQNLRFSYPKAALSEIPQKVSASQAAHSENEDYFSKVLTKPKFLSASGTDAVGRGTAHHTFLQYCDFAAARDDPEAEITRLQQLGKLTQEQAACIDCQKIRALLSGSLFARIVRAQRVYREQRFTVSLHPSLIDEVYRDAPPQTRVIMQGAVDLAFEEDGRLVIVDYKTDRVSDINKLLSLYSKQLLLYKEAMEQTLGIPVSELIICSVHLNQYIIL